MWLYLRKVLPLLTDSVFQKWPQQCLPSNVFYYRMTLILLLVRGRGYLCSVLLNLSRFYPMVWRYVPPEARPANVIICYAWDPPPCCEETQATHVERPTWEEPRPQLSAFAELTANNLHHCQRCEYHLTEVDPPNPSQVTPADNA